MPETVSADAANVVRLPVGASLENIKVVGGDIVLEQPDGTTIKILNAALNIPTFVIGDAEIPKETLVAVLEGNGINVAAGPDGTISVASNQSSGGNFSDNTGEIGDAGLVIGLLDATELQFDTAAGEDLVNALLDSNDAPVIEATASGAVTEDVAVVDGNLTVSGTIGLSDADANETLTVTSAPSGQPSWSGGSLTAAQIDTLTSGFTATAGGWSYEVPNALVQFLDAGETITLSFEVTVTDDDGATDTETVTVTINGTNDAPVIEATASGAVTEDVAVVDGNLTVSGTVGLSDVDANETLTVTSAPSGQPNWSGGSLTAAQIDTLTSGFTAASSGWSYEVPNAVVQFLGAGETLTLSFTVTVTDDNGAVDTETVTITVTGTNDAPVIGEASQTSGAVT
ncbi:VCBS domain-containing protein, partial [Sinorhizobium glycinis]|uniref:VCBS domain-containing protein n=1 Tax=Sinorhizobium glycinis TaxID=1472378 RepID=UPI0018EF3E9F